MFNVGIVAHINRLAAAERLADATGAQFISVDDGTLGCDANHRQVWGWHLRNPAAWSVTLEDDAIPVPAFRQQLTAALQSAPSGVVSLYLGQARPPQYQRHIHRATAEADAVGACWISSSHALHAVGLAIRSDLVPSLVGTVSNLPADQHVGMWARRARQRVSYTWPSLVDHADAPTLVQHPDGGARQPGRVAWRTGTRDSWTTASVPLLQGVIRVAQPAVR